MKPIGKVTVTKMIPRDSVNDVAVSCQLVCTDEEGTEFTFTAIYLNMELKPYNAEQDLTYQSWLSEVKALDKWDSLVSINFEPSYRAGLLPQEAYHNAIKR